MGLNQMRWPHLGYVCVVKHRDFSVTAERTRGEIHMLQRGLASDTIGHTSSAVEGRGRRPNWVVPSFCGMGARGQRRGSVSSS